jgi:hypothetical protein
LPLAVGGTLVQVVMFAYFVPAQLTGLNRALDAKEVQFRPPGDSPSLAVPRPPWSWSMTQHRFRLFGNLSLAVGRQNE